MKAILDQDRIIRLTPKGSIEVGRMIKGVGLDRLRFDGSKLVDLATLSEMWVKPMNGMFELHAVKVPGSQKVTMTYADRKNLIDENGMIRVKGAAEISVQALNEQKAMLKSRLRRSIEKDTGDIRDNVADLYKIVTALIAYVVAGGDEELNFLTDTLVELRVAYPLDGPDQAKLMERLKGLADKMVVYRKDKDGLDNS